MLIYFFRFLAIFVTIATEELLEFYIPEGVTSLHISAITSEFMCTKVGYFADVDNNCEIFHICQSFVDDNGLDVFNQYSFACNNGTVFDQLSLTCILKDQAIPCIYASLFYKDNFRLPKERPPYPTAADLEVANSLGTNKC